MPEITESSLTRELNAGTLRNLYVVKGEEKYLVKRTARRILSRAAGEDFAEFNRNEFPSTAAVDAIADAAMALPFFAEHKCVSVADLNLDERDAAEQKKLLELIEALPESTTLVFWYPTLEIARDPSAKWKKFLKAAEEHGAVVRCDPRTAADLAQDLQKRAERMGCVLARANANRMIEYAGQDTIRLLSELEKLCAYTLGRGETEITREMIEELAYKSTETTVFLMRDALIRGNYEQAYGLLDTLFYQNEKAVAILGALAAAYIDMYRVQTALESGRPATAISAYGDYYNPRALERRARDAQRDVRRLGAPALQKSLELLLEADSALKSSRLSDQIILEELIAKLLLAARGERA